MSLLLNLQETDGIFDDMDKIFMLMDVTRAHTYLLNIERVNGI